MVDITAGMVKDLREKTGAGMMDCKSALAETAGDMEKAIDFLRTKGLSKAAKKSGRVASEGLVGVAVDGKFGVIVEVNSETDFVARNEKFQHMVSRITDLALRSGTDVDILLRAAYPDTKETVQGYIQNLIASIGENMTLRRVESLSVDEGVVVSYVHNSIVPGLGRMAVLVGLKSSANTAELVQLGEQVAMHVAASSPLSTRVEDLDPDLLERERAIYVEQAQMSGKPSDVVEKMVAGRLRKFCEESVLLSQVFVMDGEKTVSQFVKSVGDRLGATIEITGFKRVVLGDGIEKQETDFAADVAAAASGS